MGLYAYINENDRINMRKVNDLDVKQVFEEALQYDKTLMLTEGTFYKGQGLFRKPKEVKHFAVYHEEFVDGKPIFQARQQMSASGSKAVVVAYLYGIINGCLSNKKPINQEP